MEAPFILRHDCPKKKANCISKLFFCWVVPLFYTGTKRQLTLKDLYKPTDKDKSSYLVDRLETCWNKELEKARGNDHYKPSLLKAAANAFWGQYYIYGIYMFIVLICFRSPLPVLLSWLISLFQSTTDFDRSGMYSAAAGIVLLSFGTVLLQHQAIVGTLTAGMRLRVAVSSLVNKKILKLSKRALGQTAAGQIVNILSNDCQRFDFIAFYFHYLWIMPFVIILVTYLLWRMFGVSCFIGVGTMIIFTIPFQGYLGKASAKFRRQTAERTDERVNLMSQIISGIRVIKMYAWERPFEKVIKLLRCKEIKVVTMSSHLRGFYLSSQVFLEKLALCLTLVSYTLLGNQINAGIVFSAAQFLNILQYVTAIMYPMAIKMGAEALVSIKRVEDLLLLEEKEEFAVQHVEEEEISIHRAVAYWVPEYTILKKIDLIVPRGKLCAVIGPVGAGKSSLLQLLLGELTLISGTVRLGGTVSYASQEPWLFAASVRKNILFGKEYNPEIYKKITKICALTTDFRQFPYGDKTLVGESGVTLSGGQRARINLARAIYRQADIYLLDDPLSAVDTHVGKHLFEECIIKYLKGKSRILVTHQLQYLKKADIIVVLNEGSIVALGSFEELKKGNLDFTKKLGNAEESSNAESKDDVVRDTGEFISFENSLERSTESVQMIGEDFQVTGDSALWAYMKSVNNSCTVSFLILVLIVSQVGCTACDLWSALWCRQEEMRYLENATILISNQEQVLFARISDNYTSYSHINSTSNLAETLLGLPYKNIFDQVVINDSIYLLIKSHLAMYIYGLLIMVVILLTIARSILFVNVSMKATKNVHSTVFHSLLKAPMIFFDENPSGRILNRFSKDMGAIDEMLPKTLLEALQIMLVMFGVLVVVTISNYYMLVAIFIFGAAFMKIRSWYLASARTLKHLEGIAKSPVFSHISSSLRGLITIRAFQAENELSKEFDEHQDAHTAAYYLTIICGELFGLWLDVICVIFIAVVCFGFVILADVGYKTSGSLIGLAISQSLVLTGMLQYGMKQTAETVSYLTSVDRVLQYTKLENEGPFETTEGKLPILPWPCFGKIEFKNLSLSYVEEDGPVLKNLNLIINSGEKIGVAGRTGAGKSSLISALFRLAPFEGQVLIDDLDTKRIGLTDLRNKISIIPQEPVLFSASLRFNLDPFNEFDDEGIWTALEEVELKEVVPTLDFEVAESGSNFSLGERQLLCLARALLRNNKILVLDEATANVDAINDSLIQKTIRRKFEHCTVITIAHRLNTIMDSDNVLVMDGGHIAEFDHPHKLLQKPQGLFTQMVLETGPVMADQLRAVALNAWNNRKDNVYDKCRLRY